MSSIMESALAKTVWTTSFNFLSVTQYASENWHWCFDCSGFGFYVDDHGNMLKKPQVRFCFLESE